MKDARDMAFTEEELDTLVSIAIRRAEVLDEVDPVAATDAWVEVMIYEEKLAALIPADEITGGIARVGAITAALAAGRSHNARELAERYLGEEKLPSERREAISIALREHERQREERFPALAKRGLFPELDQWKTIVPTELTVFPAFV